MAVPSHCPNRKRAAGKLALFIGVTAAILFLAVMFVSQKAVNGLINHLTVGVLVALVVIANLVSLLIGLTCFAAYRWIRRDFAPDDE